MTAHVFYEQAVYIGLASLFELRSPAILAMSDQRLQVRGGVPLEFLGYDRLKFWPPKFFFMGVRCFETFPDGSLVFSLLKNGSDQGLILTIPAGQPPKWWYFSGAAVLFAAGDLFAVRLVSTCSQDLAAVCGMALFLW
jgi:hypothetical protein